MRLVLISDTHSFYDDRGDQDKVEIPEGDVLIHAGDATMGGDVREIARFSQWLWRQRSKFKHGIVFIAGNHDGDFQRNPQRAVEHLNGLSFRNGQPPFCTYLCDQEVVIDGLRIWGSPWTPTFCNWYFMLERGMPLREKWDLIPKGIDVLVTHGP